MIQQCNKIGGGVDENGVAQWLATIENHRHQWLATWQPLKSTITNAMQWLTDNKTIGPNGS